MPVHFKYNNEEFVKNIVEYSNKIIEEVVKADFKATNVDASKIGRYGEIIHDSAKIYQGLVSYRSMSSQYSMEMGTFSNYLSVINSIAYQSECTKTKEKILKEISKLKIELAMIESECAPERGKAYSDMQLERLLKEYRDRYEEEFSFVRTEYN